MSDMRTFINISSGAINKELPPVGPDADVVVEAEKKATCGCTSSCNHCEDNHTVDQIGQICECCGNEIKAINEASDCDASCPKSCPDCGGTGKAIKKEAVGDFAEPIYDLIDELGDSSIVLDNLIRYLDGDTIKDFVSDFRREHDMNNTEESKDPTSDEEWSKLLKIPNRKSWEKMVKSSKEIDADSINESAYLDKVKKLLG